MRVSIAHLALLLTAAISLTFVSACGDSSSNDPAGSVSTPLTSAEPRTPSSDEAVIRDLFYRQLALFRAGNFDALYANYSPEFRQKCSQDALAGSIAASEIDAGKLEFEDVKVVVAGDQAHVTYTTVYDGERVGEIGSADPDIYTRTDGRWYDELDAHTHC